MVDLGDLSKEIQKQCFFRKFRSWRPKMTIVRRDSALTCFLKHAVFSQVGLRMTHSCFHRITAEFLLSSSPSHVRLFVTPWTAAHQASLFITNLQSLLKLRPTELVMPSNHLILYHPLRPLSIFPSFRVFFNESVLHIRWPKCWSFSFSISPSNNIQDRFP